MSVARGREVFLVTGADLSDGAPGGSRTYVVGLARSLAADGVRPTLLTNGPAAGPLPGIQVVSVGKARRPSSVGYLWDLLWWSRSHRLPPGTIVHAQRPDDLVPLLLTQTGVRPVCTLHGDARRGVKRRNGVLASLIHGVLERYALRRSCAVIAVDDRTAERYRRRSPGVARALSVIPPAVDREVFRPGDREAAREALGLGSGPVVLFVGRLSAEKRVSEIVRAMDDRRLRGATLLIVGDGPEEAQLRRLAADRRVRFLGRRPARDVAACINAADVLALPSEYEGLPTAALEALACGRPVVAMKGTGLDDVIVPMVTGLLVDSIESFPEGLAEVLAAAPGMREDCVKAAARFSWERVGRDVREVYDRIGGVAA